MHPEEWIYGLNPVFEAMKAGRRIGKIYLSFGRHERAGQLRDEAKKHGVPLETRDVAFFERFPKGHQGVAARVARKEYLSLDELLVIPERRNEQPLFLILDGVEDPRNFGAILRSAEAAGVHGVVIQSRRSATLGPEATKASAGAVEHVPVCMVSNIKNAMREMRKRGIAGVGAETGDYPAVWETDLTGPLALVIGSEGRGARRTVKEHCDIIVTIPMKGKINSLNASVAAGVTLFEILRQRWIKNKKF